MHRRGAPAFDALPHLWPGVQHSRQFFIFLLSNALLILLVFGTVGNELPSMGPVLCFAEELAVNLILFNFCID